MLRCWKRLRLTQLASSDMRMSAKQRFGRHFSMIALVSILAGTIGNTLPSAAADPGSTEQSQYQVQHSKFGKRGTYTNVVQVAGANIPTRQYEINGATPYKIWFDQNDIPVMFAVDDDSGKITFTLER